jgi:hypothetical protein
MTMPRTWVASWAKSDGDPPVDSRLREHGEPIVHPNLSNRSRELRYLTPLQYFGLTVCAVLFSLTLFTCLVSVALIVLHKLGAW